MEFWGSVEIWIPFSTREMRWPEIPEGCPGQRFLNHHLPQPDIIAENKAAFCFDLSGQEHRFLNQGQQCGRMGCRTGSGGCSDAQKPRPGGQLLVKGGDRMEEG